MEQLGILRWLLVGLGVVATALIVLALILHTWSRRFQGLMDLRIRELEESREQMKRRAEEVSTLYKIGLATTSTLHLDEVLEVIYREVSQLIPLDAFYIALYRAEQQELHFELFVEDGQKKDKFSRKLALGEGLTEWILRTGQPLLVQDWEGEKGRFPVPSIVLGEAPQSWLGVPLTVKDKTIGVISLQAGRTRAFSERDEQFLLTIAQQAAIAIENADLFEEMRRLADTDGLTNLYNHRFFYHALEQEIARGARYQRRFSLVMVEIDHFKVFNDSYGHPAGDELLKELARVLLANTRQADIVCRYGGDEFAMILPESDRESALILANRLCLTISEKHFLYFDMPTPARVTISLGIAAYPQDGASVQLLVRSADAALYAAKRSGKNRVCTADSVLSVD